MEKNTKESLIKALSFCSLRDVPQEWDKENVYLRALGFVEKTDGSKSYVLLEKDETGEDAIVKDFGTISAIHKIVSIHPFFFLDAKWLPMFKGKGKAGGDTKEKKIEWLEKFGFYENISDLSVKQLDRLILNVAIKNALAQNPLI